MVIINRNKLNRSLLIVIYIYVKSWRITLAGRKGISTSCWDVLIQSRIFSTSASLTLKSSQLRTA